jgi:hypothetical protein
MFIIEGVCVQERFISILKMHGKEGRTRDFELNIIKMINGRRIS